MLDAVDARVANEHDASARDAGGGPVPDSGVPDSPCPEGSSASGEGVCTVQTGAALVLDVPLYLVTVKLRVNGDAPIPDADCQGNSVAGELKLARHATDQGYPYNHFDDHFPIPCGAEALSLWLAPARYSFEVTGGHSNLPLIWAAPQEVEVAADREVELDVITHTVSLSFEADGLPLSGGLDCSAADPVALLDVGLPGMSDWTSTALPCSSEPLRLNLGDGEYELLLHGRRPGAVAAAALTRLVVDGDVSKVISPRLHEVRLELERDGQPLAPAAACPLGAANVVTVAPAEYPDFSTLPLEVPCGEPLPPLLLPAGEYMAMVRPYDIQHESSYVVPFEVLGEAPVVLDLPIANGRVQVTTDGEAITCTGESAARVRFEGSSTLGFVVPCGQTFVDYQVPAGTYDVIISAAEDAEFLSLPAVLLDRTEMRGKRDLTFDAAMFDVSVHYRVNGEDPTCMPDSAEIAGATYGRRVGDSRGYGLHAITCGLEAPPLRLARGSYELTSLSEDGLSNVPVTSTTRTFEVVGDTALTVDMESVLTRFEIQGVDELSDVPCEDGFGFLNFSSEGRYVGRLELDCTGRAQGAIAPGTYDLTLTTGSGDEIELARELMVPGADHTVRLALPAPIWLHVTANGQSMASSPLCTGAPEGRAWVYFWDVSAGAPSAPARMQTAAVPCPGQPARLYLRSGEYEVVVAGLDESNWVSWYDVPFRLRVP